MVIFNNETENLTKRDIKFLIGSFTVITVATVLGLYIYDEHIKRRIQSQSLGEMNKMPPNIEDVKPELMLEITTCEYYDDIWNPVLSHTFYGNTEDEIYRLVEVHKKYDLFFKSSFEGFMLVEDGTITLKNIDSGIMKA